MDPVDQTVQTYTQNFAAYKAGTEQSFSPEFNVWMDEFLHHVPPRGRILELGTGFGRGGVYCRDKGYTVLCTDVVPEAVEMVRDLGFETALYDFRDLPRPEWIGVFDAVLASAVLLHAPAHVFDVALSHIAVCLKKGGVVALTLKAGEGEEVTSHKMGAPRYFRYHTADDVTASLTNAGFSTIDVRHAKNDTWLLVLARKT